MTSYRHFGSDVEAIAAGWRDAVLNKDTWLPKNNKTLEKCAWVEKDGQECRVKRQGRFAGNPEFSNVKEGLAKEKIVADLGFDLDMPVAPGTLWRPPEIDEIWYISLNPFKDEEALDLCKMYGADKQENKRRLAADISVQSTALWVFHSWIGDAQEHSARHDNMLISVRDDRPVISAIDHGDAAMAFVKPTGLLTRLSSMSSFNPAVDIYEVPPMDAVAARNALGRIQEYASNRVEEIVYRVPDDLLCEGGKQQIVEGLIHSAQNLDKHVDRFFAKYGEEGTLNKRRVRYSDASFKPAV